MPYESSVAESGDQIRHEAVLSVADGSLTASNGGRLFFMQPDSLTREPSIIRSPPRLSGTIISTEERVAIFHPHSMPNPMSLMVGESKAGIFLLNAEPGSALVRYKGSVVELGVSESLRDRVLNLHYINSGLLSSAQALFGCHGSPVLAVGCLVRGQSIEVKD